MNRLKINSGFTLLELLVVIALIGILTTISASALSRFNRSQSIEIANDNLQTSLSEAKSNALSHVIVNCTDGELLGYRIVFISSTPLSYTSLQEVCRRGAVDSSVEVKRTNLPSGITFSGSNPSITFKVLSGGADSASSVTITNGTIQKTIEVTTAGVIQEND